MRLENSKKLIAVADPAKRQQWTNEANSKITPRAFKNAEQRLMPSSGTGKLTSKIFDDGMVGKSFDYGKATSSGSKGAMTDNVYNGFANTIHGDYKKSAKKTTAATAATGALLAGAATKTLKGSAIGAGIGAALGGAASVYAVKHNKKELSDPNMRYRIERAYVNRQARKALQAGHKVQINQQKWGPPNLEQKVSKADFELGPRLKGISLDTDEHVIWPGAMRQGYGVKKMGTTTINAHRYVYENATGKKIPKGWHIDHKCRERRCINPKHLEPVSPGENKRRAWQSKYLREGNKDKVTDKDVKKAYALPKSAASQFKRLESAALKTKRPKAMSENLANKVWADRQKVLKQRKLVPYS